MADPANAEAATEQEVTTPAPLGTVDSLAEYRERRGEADGLEADEPEPKAAEVKPEPKADDDVTGDPDPASEAGKALAKKRGSLQSRIDELTREKHQTASEAQAAKAEAAALKAELAALKAGKQPEPKAAEKAEPAIEADPNDPEPKVEKYDDYEKYTRDVARWEARQENRRIAAESASRQAETARGERLSRVMSAGAEAHPDFHEKAAAYESAGGQYSPVAQQIILSHELGHEFAYALMTDPAVAGRINGAESPAIAMLEAGAVLADIRRAQDAAKAPKEPKAKPVSKAPAPVEPLASAESAASLPDPSKMSSIREWERVRDKIGV